MTVARQLYTNGNRSKVFSVGLHVAAVEGLRITRFLDFVANFMVHGWKLW
jgi:hypothetical protein